MITGYFYEQNQMEKDYFTWLMIGIHCAQRAKWCPDNLQRFFLNDASKVLQVISIWGNIQKVLAFQSFQK